MDWLQAFSAGLRLWTMLRLMKSQGHRGRVRTKLLATFEDGTEDEYPFITFEV